MTTHDKIKEALLDVPGLECLDFNALADAVFQLILEDRWEDQKPLFTLIADWENRAKRQSAEADRLLEEDPEDIVLSTEVRRIGNYYSERIKELTEAMVAR